MNFDLCEFHPKACAFYPGGILSHHWEVFLLSFQLNSFPWTAYQADFMNMLCMGGEL